MVALGPGARVLITGSTGLVGRHVAKMVAATGAEMHGVSRGRAEGCYETHVADLLESSGVDRLIREVRPTHLVHLAWTTVHGEFWNDPANLDWVVATLGLLRGFHGAGGRRAVLVGSCAEYDWNVPGPYTETQAGPQPATLYGAAKLAAATASLGYCRAGGPEVTWARLFHLYGPGESPERLLPRLVAAAVGGQPLALENPQQIVDLLHVYDAAAALVAVLDSSVVGAINVASGTETTLRDLATRVADIVGVPTPPHETHAEEVVSRRVVADVGRLREEVGFRPRIALDQGLVEVCAGSQNMETT